MKGGKRKGAGRRPVQIDLVQLERLCAIQCTDEDLNEAAGAAADRAFVVV
jgi:hypothetical protein